MNTPFTLGLLNNMPDAALRQTERQFAAMAAAALPGHTLRLELFALESIQRGGLAMQSVAARYRPASQIRTTALDALVVSGMEPGRGPMRHEAFWPEFASCVDLAVRRDLPTLWSCLAAHAAVLHLDGIERRRLPAKLSGCYDCVAADGHAATWRCVQSRHNDLAEADLAAAGYRIASRLAGGGVDSFVKDDHSFLFLQGHPEYEANTLRLEFVRDLQRFRDGTCASRPVIPRGYFTQETESRLEAEPVLQLIRSLPHAQIRPPPILTAGMPVMQWFAAIGQPRRQTRHA